MEKLPAKSWYSAYMIDLNRWMFHPEVQNDIREELKKEFKGFSIYDSKTV